MIYFYVNVLESDGAFLLIFYRMLFRYRRIYSPVEYTSLKLRIGESRLNVLVLKTVIHLYSV